MRNGRISGPLLDRIDIHLEVPAVPFQELSSSSPGTSSADIRQQVTAARQLQTDRFRASHTRTNSQMTHRQIRTHCRLAPDGQKLLQSAMDELGLSARAHDKILRVARTIADLEPSESIQVHHVSEAVNYRMLDRQLWV